MEWTTDRAIEGAEPTHPEGPTRREESPRDMEQSRQEINTRPKREAGFTRPGCWNCGVFGHSRVNCTHPRQCLLHVWYMCGRPGLAIATCPTCYRTCVQHRTVTECLDIIEFCMEKIWPGKILLFAPLFEKFFPPKRFTCIYKNVLDAILPCCREFDIFSIWFRTEMTKNNLY